MKEKSKQDVMYYSALAFMHQLLLLYNKNISLADYWKIFVNISEPTVLTVDR